MKMMKLKAFALIPAALVSLTLSGFGQSMTAAVEKERADIRQDLVNIQNDRSRIASLKEKYREDRRDGNRTAMVTDKEQLRKAKANLEKNEAYLSADKAAMMCNHQLAIRNARKEVKKNKKELADQKREFKRSGNTGNYASVALERSENRLERSEAVLKARVERRNDDLLSVNREIRKTNGEMAGKLYVEDGLAYSDQWLRKR